MRILPKPLAFEWDEGNIRKNAIKHRVGVLEAEEVFMSKTFLTVLDTAHSTPLEQRYQGLGQSATGRRLFVAFTIRDKKIRVISVRDMKRKEKVAYEQFKANS